MTFLVATNVVARTPTDLNTSRSSQLLLLVLLLLLMWSINPKPSCDTVEFEQVGANLNSADLY